MDPTDFENEQTVLTHQQAGTLDEFHRCYEEAIAFVRADLGHTHPLVIDGQSVETDDEFTVTSPGETDLAIGTFASGDADDVDRAVSAAAGAFDDWRHIHWSDRIEIFRDAAHLMADRKYELAAILTLENGKNRTEAMADIDEGIDFLRFYAQELEENVGYVYDTGEPTPGQHCTNGLEPFGVFAVVGPFNFPFAIFAVMTVGALVTGNTVVAKPASTTPLIAHEVVDMLSEAGVPDGALNLVTGGGSAVGQPLVEHTDVDGVVFTGSRDVGRSIRRTFFEQEKSGPVIAELGGKNPVIVTEHADMEKAVSGVANGAFGFSGQKCSASARVYVHRDLVDVFTERLVTEAGPSRSSLPIGRTRSCRRSSTRARWSGTSESVKPLARTERCSPAASPPRTTTSRTDGTSNRRSSDIPHGHELAREEHFLPFVTIHPVSDLDEAITKANESEYGLCAGLFSEDDAEIEEWFDRIESGMCYVNREQSATTGALVQAQPFGGWKASGTTSKFAGGYWYLPQFMREQTRTVVGDAGRQ